MTRRQRHAEVADSVRTRQEPRQNAGVRTIGNRAGRERLRETDSFFCDRIERGSLNLFVAVAVHVVSAQSVNCDEKDIWALRDILCSRARRSNSANHTTTK